VRVIKVDPLDPLTTKHMIDVHPYACRRPPPKSCR
jgi:hypothetical protein